MKITGQTTIKLAGRGTYRLSPADFLASGGEASVYRLHGIAVKLYTDPKKLTLPGVLDNLQCLTGLRHEHIISPQGLVFDSSDRAIGYYMEFVDSGDPLSSVFATSFRNRTGLGNAEATFLVDKMLGVMDFAHKHNTLMVDPNELNWSTVAKDGKWTPRSLDVDSWLAGSFLPPSVPKMPSIRDWHNPGVSRESDRFALAVVTFQVFTGIHPYRGTLDGYAPRDLEQRMRNNASVFTKGVRLNRAVRSFDAIPGGLLGWYEAVFQQGDRSAPPSAYATVHLPPRHIQVARIVANATGKLQYSKVFERHGDPVVESFPCGAVLLRSGDLIDISSQKVIMNGVRPGCEVVRQNGNWLVAQQATVTYVEGASFTRHHLAVTAQHRQIVRAGNRLLMLSDTGLRDIGVTKFAKPVLSLGRPWAASQNLHWFDGVGVMNELGASFVVVPFGEGSCVHVRIRELDNLRVIAAKGYERFVSLVCMTPEGEYRKVELYLDANYRACEKVHQTDQENGELNLAILPKGVCATIAQDGELAIFVPANGSTVRVADRDATTDTVLGNWDNKVVFIRDGQLWHVSLTQ